MSSKTLKKAVSLVCAFALILCSVCMTGGAEVSAMTADEAKEKLQDLQDELVAVNKELAKAKDAIEEARERAKTYTKRVEIVKEQISILQESIDAKKEELSVKQQELDAKVKEHDDTKDLFKTRLRAMYMSNDVTTLSLILGANSFSEFLVAAEMQSKISKHDTELIEKLQNEADAIAYQKEIIEGELASLENDMEILEDKYSELAALLQEANEDLTAAEAYKQVTEEDYDRVVAEMQETQAEWNELMGTGMYGYVGGYFVRTGQLARRYRYRRSRHLRQADHRVQHRKSRACALLYDGIRISRHDRPRRRLLDRLRTYELNSSFGGRMGRSGAGHRVCGIHRKLHRSPPSL